MERGWSPIPSTTYKKRGLLYTADDSATGYEGWYYYDEVDRLSRYKEYSGDGRGKHFVEFTYNAQGNLATKKETIDGESRTTNYYYNSSYGRVASIKTGDVSAHYSYDGFDRIIEQQNQYDGSKKLITQITYYPNSNQIQSLRKYAPGGDYDVTYTYTYDDNGNIRTVSDGTYTTTYRYDGANQLVREDNEKAGKTWYWLYNTAGNLWYIKEYDYTTADVLGDPTSTVTNVYGSTVWRDLLTKHGDTTITYDTIGNTLNDGTWTYTWERGRQLKSMSNGTTTWNMTYDPDGLRTSRTDGTNTYYYYYSEGLLTYMKYNALVMRFTYDANGNPVSMTYNGNIYFYVLNLQGDVMALLDADGNEVVSYHYNAWGELLSTTASTTGMLYSLALYNPLRYRGYVYDRETGLYYLQSRYYNPEICRFISADKISNLGVDGSVLSYNIFAYCLNNPVMGFDPSGHWDFGWEERAAFGATLLLVGLAIVLAAPTGGSSLVLGSVALSSTTVLATGATLGLTGTVIMGEALIEPTVNFAKKSRQSDKEKSNDHPSWLSRSDIDLGKSAHKNATELLDNKYGKGNWTKGPVTEYDWIVKWIDRGLKVFTLLLAEVFPEE